ncbi:hypothetical protein CPB86DRAFT_819588 [Serendipita vermifera]|nr:hypothetical protein CPB86DRAFT_819588 [Serendipita vermifera]
MPPVAPVAIILTHVFRSLMLVISSVIRDAHISQIIVEVVWVGILRNRWRFSTVFTAYKTVLTYSCKAFQTDLSASPPAGSMHLRRSASAFSGCNTADPVHIRHSPALPSRDKQSL